MMGQTLEKRGRRPALGDRYPGEKLKPARMNTPTLQEIADARDRARRETEAEVMATARSQPHRRDLKEPDSRWADSALGRFCLANRLRKEIYDAGLMYQVIYDRHCAAWGAPCQRRSGGGRGGMGEGPTMRTVAEWRSALEGCSRAISDAGGVLAVKAIKLLCHDDIDIHPLEVAPAIIAFPELARYLGLGSLRTPFE